MSIRDRFQAGRFVLMLATRRWPCPIKINDLTLSPSLSPSLSQIQQLQEKPSVALSITASIKLKPPRFTPLTVVRSLEGIALEEDQLINNRSIMGIESRGWIPLSGRTSPRFVFNSTRTGLGRSLTRFITKKRFRSESFGTAVLGSNRPAISLDAVPTGE